MNARLSDYIKLYSFGILLLVVGFLGMSVASGLLAWAVHVNTWGSPLFMATNGADPWVYFKGGMGFMLFIGTLLLWLTLVFGTIHLSVKLFLRYHTRWKEALA